MNTQEIKVTNAQTIRIDAKLQDKIVIPSLEKQNVLPDESYDGLSKVVVDAVSLENKTVKPNRDTQIITPTETLGFSSVTIELVSLESKSVVPSKEVQILNPSDEFIGFSEVVVDKIPNEYIIPEGNLNIISNGEYDVTNNASVKVNVDKQPNLQDKEARVTAPTNIFVHPDEDYDGLAFVNVIATVDAEQVEVTPTKEEQILTPSEKTYFDSVIVNPIPDNYIEPSGELNIIENGNYDVTDKESINVDIQPNLGTKTITENGTYNASDDNLDGYSSVEVAISGANLDEYFVTTYDSNKMYWVRDNFHIKSPDLIIGNNTNTLSYLCSGAGAVIPKVICNDNIVDFQYLYQSVTATEIDVSGLNSNNVKYMQYMFQGCSKVTNLDLSHFITSNVTNMSYMFKSCSSLAKLDLSNFVTANVTNMSQMFYGCSKLATLDIRNFDFTSVTSYSNMFYNVPTDCEIIVKDDTAKTWVLDKRSDFTNVKTVAELEA